MAIELLNIDCIKYMNKCKDKQFDLAIVDPPYGLGNKLKGGKTGMIGKYKTFDNIIRKKWDIKPNHTYFNELFRISVNQIIWGGNYFIEHLRSTQCFISWDKVNGTNDLADFELAWTSFNSSCRRFSMHHFSSGYDKKIHPTQKPVKLYSWLLKKYAKDGDKIFDSHLGSCSIAIACLDYGFDLVGCEIDKGYYNDGVKRVMEYKKQLKLF